MGDGIEIGFSLLIRDHGVCREPVVGEELRPAVGQQPVGRKKARVVAQPPEGSMDTTVETVAIVEDMGDVDGTQSDLPAVEVDKGLELVGPQFGSHQWRLPRGETGAQPVIGSLPAEVGGWQPADVGIDHMSRLSHQFETKGDYGIQFFVTVHLGLAGRRDGLACLGLRVGRLCCIRRVRSRGGGVCVGCGRIGGGRGAFERHDILVHHLAEALPYALGGDDGEALVVGEHLLFVLVDKLIGGDALVAVAVGRQPEVHVDTRRVDGKGRHLEGLRNVARTAFIAKEEVAVDQQGAELAEVGRLDVGMEVGIAAQCVLEVEGYLLLRHAAKIGDELCVVLLDEAIEHFRHTELVPGLADDARADRNGHDGFAEVDAVLGHVVAEVCALLVGDIEGEVAALDEVGLVDERVHKTQVATHAVYAWRSRDAVVVDADVVALVAAYAVGRRE